MQWIFARFFAVLLLAFAFSVALPPPTQAQTPQIPTTLPSHYPNSIALPHVESNVPVNQHTFVQAITIEILNSFICQLSGIDLLNPQQACLGINLQTHKIGFAPAPDDPNKPKGLAGILTGQISMFYTPPASSDSYMRYLSDNFGIVKNAYAAQGASVGSLGLTPILPLWKLSRDIAYSLLVLVFILIGLAVMLRVKIDPRTVMSVQNQIPRVIISILLITFSYAIAGLMIDLMWTSTYVGINAITQNHNPSVGDDGHQKPLSEVVTKGVLDSPIGYFNAVFQTDHPGIFHVTQRVSGAIGGLIESIINDLMKDLIKAEGNKPCFNPKAFLPGGDAPINWDECVRAMFSGTFGFLAHVVAFLIVLVTILFSLFRLWFTLLKAYIFLLFYIVAGPVWIVMGLVPGRPLGFENWIRNVFVKAVVFPLSALLLLVGRMFMDAFDRPPATHAVGTQFVPPLVGNPSMENFGTLLGFGAILLTPTIMSLLEEKMKVKSSGGAAIAGALGTGAAVATALPKRQWAGWTQRNQEGKPIGFLARGVDRGIKKASTNMGSLPIVGGMIKKAGERRDNRMAGLGWKTHEELTPGWEQTQRRKLDEIEGQKAANKRRFGRNYAVTNDQLPQDIRHIRGREDAEAAANKERFGYRWAVRNADLPPDLKRQRDQINAQQAAGQGQPRVQARGPQLGQTITHPSLIPDRHKGNDKFREEFDRAAANKPWRAKTREEIEKNEDEKKDYERTIQDVQKKIAGSEGQQIAVIPVGSRPQTESGPQPKRPLLDDMRGRGGEQGTQPRTPETTPAAKPAGEGLNIQSAHVGTLTVDELLTRSGVHSSHIPDEHKNNPGFVEQFTSRASGKTWKGKPKEELDPMERGDYESVLREANEAVKGKNGGSQPPHTA